MRLLIVLLLVACTPKPLGPTVRVHYVYPEEWSKDDRKYIESTAASWKKLRLKWEFTEDRNRATNHCPSDWPIKKIVDCVIDVALYRKTGLREEGLAGYSDRGTNESWIDIHWHGLYLLHVVAHEVGHQILNTWEHVTSGIMEKGGDKWMPSKEDHALACKQLKRACD